MRKTFKILLYAFIIVLVAITGLLTYVKTMLPDVGDAPAMTVERTPERIERGRYLANHVMACMDCHSTRDWSLFSGPLVPGSEGKGGEIFDQTLGFPGKYVAPNITPHHLGTWSDGEIYRAITSGVAKDGRALFPIMPHPNYGKIDTEDIMAVIAYIRTLPVINYDPPKSESDFPMNFIINTIPKKAEPKPMPSPSDSIAYGKYLVTAASCSDCHTKQEKGKVVGAPFSGGFVFRYPDGSVAQSANITPDATGIGSWSREQFIRRFKQYSDSTYKPAAIARGQFQSVMPWTMYTHMSSNDLAAIYAYLRTVPAVKNTITKFTPAQ